MAVQWVRTTANTTHSRITMAKPISLTPHDELLAKQTQTVS